MGNDTSTPAATLLPTAQELRARRAAVLNHQLAECSREWPRALGKELRAAADVGHTGRYVSLASLQPRYAVCYENKELVEMVDTLLRAHGCQVKPVDASDYATRWVDWAQEETGYEEHDSPTVVRNP